MNILPPSFKFDGDKNKAISLKAYAGQFYNLITTQAAKEGVPHVTRTKRFPDGTIINFKAQKNSLFNNWSGRVEIFATPPIINPLKLEEELLVYWYRTSGTTFIADGTIYFGGSPILNTEPILPLGNEVYNGNLNISASISQYGFYNRNKDIASSRQVLFNRRRSISSLYRASGSSNTIERSFVYSGLNQGESVAATGINIGDHRYIGDAVFSTSTTQSGDRVTIYLDKVVGTTKTLKAEIFFEANPLTFTITVYHDILGTNVLTLTSSIPTYTFFDNPRVLSLELSPDCHFLSIVIGDRQSEVSTAIIDVVIKLDSNGVYAHPDDGLTTNVSNGSSKTNYSSVISQGYSAAITTFSFESGFDSSTTKVGAFSGTEYSGTTTTTYSAVNTGNPVVGLFYTNTKDSNNEYERFWIDCVSKFVDNSYATVTANLTVTDTYSYPKSLSDTPPFHNPVTASNLVDGDTLSYDRVYGTNARGIYELSYNSTVISRLLSNIILNTDIKLSKKLVGVIFTYSGTGADYLGFSELRSYPIDYSDVKISDPFLMSNNSVDAPTLTSQNEVINILTTRSISNTWLKPDHADTSLYSDYSINPTFYNEAIPNGADTLVSYETDVLMKMEVFSGTTIIPVYTSPLKNTLSGNSPTFPNAIFNYTTGPGYTHFPRNTVGTVTTTDHERTAFVDIISSQSSREGLVHKLSEDLTLYFSQHSISYSGNNSFYTITLNGTRVPSLQSIPAFSDFASGSLFGVGFSI